MQHRVMPTATWALSHPRRQACDGLDLPAVAFNPLVGVHRPVQDRAHDDQAVARVHHLVQQGGRLPADRGLPGL